MTATATQRTLQPGESAPDGEPRRYLSERGYIRLRWLVGPSTYVEVYEHRLVMGMPAADVEIHHINGVKTDNRKENLIALSKVEHATLHASLKPKRAPGPRVLHLEHLPACMAPECERPAQCRDNTLCLMHYKRWKRSGTIARPIRGRFA